ncbi:hypothetical protein D1007_44207 [Hordeum vulgare]|nr:hypothetical protein D1007_44207 [Hordeum vulgare]
MKGKAGGDSKSSAAVAASPPMAGDAGQGYRGDMRKGFGAGRDGQGAGRGADRGNGRGGKDRSKYSWKREEGDDRTNTTSSQVASGSDDTSRWEAVTAMAPSRQGHLWFQLGLPEVPDPPQIRFNRNERRLPLYLSLVAARLPTPTNNACLLSQERSTLKFAAM